ncbi:hypothetical protein [Vibrio sp. NH-UV-68]|uniref:hypothetical protein n=1 Tax=unclassified Vibrio TaxID=2614977 RepID=UPI0036F239AD
MSKFAPRAILLLLSLLFSIKGYAATEMIELVANNEIVRISVAELREQADTEMTIYAPYRSQDVAMKGVYVEDLLAKHFPAVPNSITLTALDGYAVKLDDWLKKHWLLVTHENGQPLTLRQHGPVRLVESSYEGRDPSNLRNFNNWIWMVVRIEAN